MDQRFALIKKDYTIHAHKHTAIHTESLWVSACSSANRILNKNTYTRFTIIWFVSRYGVTARQLQFFRIEKKGRCTFRHHVRALAGFFSGCCLLAYSNHSFNLFIHTEMPIHPSMLGASYIWFAAILLFKYNVHSALAAKIVNSLL